MSASDASVLDLLLDMAETDTDHPTKRLKVCRFRYSGFGGDDGFDRFQKGDLLYSVSIGMYRPNGTDMVEVWGCGKTFDDALKDTVSCVDKTLAERIEWSRAEIESEQKALDRHTDLRRRVGEACP